MTKTRPWSAVKASLDAKVADGTLKGPLPWANAKNSSGTGKPAEPRPWSEISSDLEVYRGSRLYTKPVPSMLLSTGMMADSKLMPWILERMKTIYDCAFQYEGMPRSLSRWIWFANILLTQDDGRFAQDGYNLMYTLAIKPFTTLAQADQAAREDREDPAAERAG